MRSVLRAAALAALAMLPGCGSDYGPGPSPSPTPSSVRTVVATKTMTVPGGLTASETVDNVPAGTVDVRLDWTDPAVDLNLYVTDTNCSSIVEILAGACRILGQDTAATRPATTSFAATGPANYAVWVRNISTVSAAATFEVGVTR